MSMLAGVTRERYRPLRQELETRFVATLTLSGQTAEPAYWLRRIAAQLSAVGTLATRRTVARRVGSRDDLAGLRAGERAAALELAALALAYAAQLDRLVADDEQRTSLTTNAKV